MRNPPLCQLWQLTQSGAGTYSLIELADMHEAMDMETEANRRQAEAAERSRQK